MCIPVRVRVMYVYVWYVCGYMYMYMYVYVWYVCGYMYMYMYVGVH